MKLARKIIIVLNICLISLLIVSCDDIFHNVSNFLEEVSRNSNIQEPKRIFIGGNFTYNSIGSTTNREAFAVLDGNGNYDNNFFQAENSENGIGGATEGSSGVRSIKILNEFIYVAGDFESYDSSLDDTLINNSYRNIVRYSSDGSLNTYSPASAMAVSEIVFDILPLPDGSLFAGGNFTEGLIKIEPDATIVTTNTPTLTGGSEVYSLQLNDSDYSLLFIGGNFSNYTLDSGLENYAVADGVNFILPGLSSTPIASTKIKDLEFSSFGVFIAGIHGGSGILVKYNYSGAFELDIDFLIQIQTYPFSALDVNTVAVSDNGFIYLGGNFTTVMDSQSNQHNNLLRLYPNGEIDSTFQISPTGEVHVIEIQRNGAILVGGSFTSVDVNNFMNSESTNGYFRINNEGQFDSDFDRFGIPGMAGGIIYSFAIEEYDQE